MSFKTELHCHSSEFSLCSSQSGVDKAEQYIKAGYTTVALTNHYSWWLPGWEDHKDFTRRFFRAGEIMREAAGDRLYVLTGIELRFRENINDYLVYGLTEDVLLDMPNIHDLGIEEFYKIAKELGILVIQAHPFRPGMTVTNPDFLDGMEVHNGTHGRPMYDEIAEYTVERYNHYYDKKLIRTSGSDHHNAGMSINSGITTDSPIRSMDELINVLKSGSYELIV